MSSVRRRRLRSIGLVLVVLGAAVLLSPTLGFDSLEADRSVTADSVSNPDAQLGLQGDYDDTQIQYTQGLFGDTVVNATVANVTNRVGNPVSVSAEVAAIDWGGGSDSVLEVSNAGAFAGQLGTNATVPIRLGCSREVGGTATNADVELDIDGTGDPVSVEDASIVIEGVSFNCEGPGSGDGDPPEDPVPIDDPDVGLQVVGQPTAEETGGWFSEASIVTWQLQNTGGDSVTVTGVHVADSEAGSRVQRTDDELIVSGETEGTLDVENGISIGSSAPQYDLEQNATIVGGQTADVELAEFRTGSSLFERVNMQGQSVTVVLMVEGLKVDGREGPVPVEMEITPS